MINRFGEDKHYPMRGFLLYDGIHYDPLYLESFNGDSQKTLFSLEEEPQIFDMYKGLFHLKIIVTKILISFLGLLT